MTTETHLGQIWTVDHGWQDYARATEAEARRWHAEDPVNRRVVDWISREILIHSEDYELADREETEPCEAGTVGCCVRHQSKYTAPGHSCVPW